MNPRQLLLGVSIVLAALVGAALPLSPIPAFAAPGKNPSGGDVLLSTKTGDDLTPAVAYNTGAGAEFLVVWESSSRIYGQRYDRQGVPLGEPFPISEPSGGSHRNPAVAYSLVGDRYLVVWQDGRNGNDDIYGQLVDAGGGLVDDNFSIYLGNGNQVQPDVDSDGDDFLIVWEGNFQDDSTEVCGRKATRDGLLGATISVATDGGTPRTDPAVAYNAWAGEYLVVLRYGDLSSSEIHARRVSAAGALPGIEYTVADQPSAGVPDLAAAPWGGTGGYVVVWTDARNSGTSYSDIFGRVVLAGSDNAFDLGDFAICAASDLQNRPVISRSPTTGQFLVAWEDNRSGSVSDWDLYGRRLTADANLLGPEFAVSDAGGEQMMPAIASSQSPDLYLIAWDDNRTGRFDVYGQRVSWNGSLLWYEFAISAQPEVQRRPAVAYDQESDQYLAVWEDQRDGHWAIYGQRLNEDGQPLEPPWVIEADGHDNMLPDVVYSGTAHFFVVVWYDAELDKLEGRHVPQAGTATILFSVLDSDGGYNPRLGYDPASARFVVVWDHNGDIYAHALDGDGFPFAGASVLVAGGPADQTHPALVLDRDEIQFLVTWTEDGQIYGCLLSQYLALLGEPFLIAGGDGIPRLNATAAYQPSTQQSTLGGGGEYLVAYERLSGGDADVYARLLYPDGSPVAAEFAIRAEPEVLNQFKPQALFAQGPDLFFVVWSEDVGGSNGYDLYAQWLAPDGAPASALLPFLTYEGNQYDPRPAYDFERQQGLVVWNDNRRGEQGDVYARLGAVDTTPPTALFTCDPTVGRLGSSFILDARPSTDDLTPPGALAVRWDWTSDGTWDTAWDLNKVASITPAAQGDYIVTLAVRDLMGLTDTMMQTVYVLPATPNTPPTAVVDVTPLFGQAGTEFQFDASGSTDAETPAASLLVRWDWESDGVWDTSWSVGKTDGHIYTESGLHLARVEVRDGGLLTDAAIQVLLVLPGDPETLQLDPPSVKLLAGATSQFRVAAWDSYGNEIGNPPVTWLVADARAGAIDADGLFTAGFVSGQYDDVVVATWDDTLSDVATVLIYYRYRLYLPMIVHSE